MKYPSDLPVAPASSPTELDRAGREARDAALLGDFGPCVPILERTDDASVGWRACFEAMRAGAGLMARGVDLHALSAASSNARVGVAFALFELARDAVARLDVPALRTVGPLLQAAASRPPASAVESLGIAAQWASAWLGALESPSAELAKDVAQLGRAAQQCGAAELVVELPALRAFVLMGLGDLAGATDAARRASRMGRTEGMPQQEYLANLVLARLRRSTGRPHLAMRILSALGPVAPARWQAWIAWEAALAGSFESAQVARGAAHDGVLLGAVEELLEGIPSDAELPAPFAAELRVVRAALGGGHEEAAGAWLSGVDPEMPPALQGLALRADARGDARVRVVVGPGLEPRRRLALRASETYALTDPPHPRTETLLCVLAQACGHGIGRDDLYQQVYGFTFDAVVHQGSFDVLLHRARAWLGDRGAIVRDDGIFRLEVARAFAIPDPRCERSLDDRLLQVLAQRGGVPAREAAEVLEVPLRTVQTLLKQLVEEGACEPEREGRKIVYRVEDTTFREPTLQSPT